MKNKLFGGILLIGVLITVYCLAFCRENYSNGERIGTITQYSETGTWFKTFEGHLNVTQTGMNSSTGFDFSIDNDNEPADVLATLDSAANNGWKVKLVYHEVRGWNWFRNRGETNHFVTKVEVLDRNFSGNQAVTGQPVGSGRAVDTIYVVILPDGRIPTQMNKTATVTTDTSAQK